MVLVAPLAEPLELGLVNSMSFWILILSDGTKLCNFVTISNEIRFVHFGKKKIISTKPTPNWAILKFLSVIK